jgi:hypothetical protein
VPYLPDLAEPGPVKSVGYLSAGHSYPTGTVSRLCFERLIALVEKPLAYSCGFHKCNLGRCSLTESLHSQPVFRYRGRVLGLGSTDILVPSEKAVYHAPSLILHYIRHHKYQPPECFCAAVLNCPEPGLAEYFAAIREIAPDIMVIRMLARMNARR